MNGGIGRWLCLFVLLFVGILPATAGAQAVRPERTCHADAIAGALRETEEEIGLARAHVEIVGRLDTYVVRTGFEVTPVVGLVTPPFQLTRDEFEVAEVFEVPLSFILDPANHQRQSRVDFGGAKREFWVFPYGDYNIWGATAGMLKNLHFVLTAPE